MYVASFCRTDRLWLVLQKISDCASGFLIRLRFEVPTQLSRDNNHSLPQWLYCTVMEWRNTIGRGGVWYLSTRVNVWCVAAWNHSLLSLKGDWPCQDNEHNVLPIFRLPKIHLFHCSVMCMSRHILYLTLELQSSQRGCYWWPVEELITGRGHQQQWRWPSSLDTHQWPHLLTWFNLNFSRDK